MAPRILGYSRELYLMPFDHRGSFAGQLLGIRGREPTPRESAQITELKRLIYEGFELAVSRGVPKDRSGVLVDERHGAEILRDARAAGYLTACPVERSGQEEFEFEFGDAFSSHLRAMRPTFAKALVRYNVDRDAEMNRRQAERLVRLTQECGKTGTLLLLELLVPPTDAQLDAAGGDSKRFDRERRTELAIRAMGQLQDAGVEPDLWKLEGVETRAEAQALAQKARNAPHRHNVALIVLGRGESAERVRHWLETAAGMPGYVGFAVGRTIFHAPLKELLEGRILRDEARDRIARGYQGFCELWRRARRAASETSDGTKDPSLVTRRDRPQAGPARSR